MSGEERSRRKGERCCAAACALLSRGCGLVSGVNGELCWELPMRTADNGLPLRVWPVRCCAGDWWGSVFGRRHSMALSNGHTAKLTHHHSTTPQLRRPIGWPRRGFFPSGAPIALFPIGCWPRALQRLQEGRFGRALGFALGQQAGSRMPDFGWPTTRQQCWPSRKAQSCSRGQLTPASLEMATQRLQIQISDAENKSWLTPRTHPTSPID